METDYYLKKTKDPNSNLTELSGWDYYRTIVCS